MKYVIFTILFAMFTYMGVTIIHDHYYLSYDSPDPTNLIAAPFTYPNRFPTPDNMTDEEWAVSVERGELVKAYYNAEKVIVTADVSNSKARGEAYRANTMAADRALGQLIQAEDNILDMLDMTDMTQGLAAQRILPSSNYYSNH